MAAGGAGGRAALIAALLAWCGAASLLALLLYGFDKSAARRGARRVPESRLLLLGLLGGAAGALAGMLLFRHKTRRAGFWAANLLALGGWAALLWRL